VQAGEATDLLLAMLDVDGTNCISESEFMQLVTVLKARAARSACTSPDVWRCPRFLQENGDAI
jgi:hypothetical protein